MYAPLLKILFTMLVMHAVSTGLRFTVTLDAIAHGGTSREVSLMLAGVALVPAFFAISAGRWLDRAGPGKPLALAIAAAAAAGALTLSFPSAVVGLWPLFAACILVGLGFMLANTITQRLTGDVLPPEKRSMGFTAVSIITAASGLVTPVLAGYAIEWRGHAAFYAFAMTAPLVLALLAFSPLMRNVFGRVRKREEKKTSGAKGAAREILADKPMRTVLISSVLISVAWEVGNLMMPIYCASVGLTPSETGWVLGSFSAASFVVRFLMPGLMRLFSEWRLISFTFLVAAVAFLLFPLFEATYALMGCSFLLGLGLGASYPNTMALVYRFAPKGRIGEAIGLRLSMMNFSKATFPIAMGALGSVIGAGATLGALGVFTGCGFLFALQSRAAVEAASAERM
ncbi:MAG: MFS transporter [Sutterella sp.]|nr:MFS transporter [Sutterella sp.]